VLLRIRGIAAGSALRQWKGNEPRLEFPVAIIDQAEVVPKTYNYIFVEPGVRHTVAFVTTISATIRYVLVHAEFQYAEYTPNVTERVFRLDRERAWRPAEVTDATDS
jgi:hypothetical protein